MTVETIVVDRRCNSADDCRHFHFRSHTYPQAALERQLLPGQTWEQIEQQVIDDIMKLTKLDDPNRIVLGPLEVFEELGSLARFCQLVP